MERDPDSGELRETGREGLITPEEFRWLQTRPGRRGSVRSVEPRQDDHDYLFSEGRTLCADCGQHMTGGRTSAGTPSYRCQSNFEGRGGCGNIRINAPRFETFVGEYVLGELARPGAQAALETARQVMAAEVEQVAAGIAALEKARTELAVPYAQGQLSRDSFVAADRRIGQDWKTQRARLRYLEQAVDVPRGGIEHLARWWEHAPVRSKRGLAVLLLEKIEVLPARARGVRAVDDRVTLTWRTAGAA